MLYKGEIVISRPSSSATDSGMLGFLRLGRLSNARELVVSIVTFAFYFMIHCLRYQTIERIFTDVNLSLR